MNFQSTGFKENLKFVKHETKKRKQKTNMTFMFYRNNNI